MLVCAFGGYERVLAAYRHAVREQYRFFSYGDAMLLSRGDDTMTQGFSFELQAQHGRPGQGSSRRLTAISPLRSSCPLEPWEP